MQNVEGVRAEGGDGARFQAVHQQTLGGLCETVESSQHQSAAFSVGGMLAPVAVMESLCEPLLVFTPHLFRTNGANEKNRPFSNR